MTIVKTLVVVAFVGCTDAASERSTTTAAHEDAEGGLVELEEAKLLVEHNATDEDTGFQGFIDGEPWQRLDVRDPDGKLLASFEAKGALRELGFTELFFETDEPPNVEVPIDDVLAILPAGDYELVGRTADGLRVTGSAALSHVIPAGPVIVSPRDGATVCADDDLEIAWQPVTASVFGGPVDITHYQLIVEPLDEEPHPGFGRQILSIHVPATTTAMRVPREFLAADTEYEFEILAIDARGNQTISSGEFSTEVR